MIRKRLGQLRTLLLHSLNVRRIRSCLSGHDLGDRLPVFVIASPPDFHLAPFSIRDAPECIFPVIVGNGLRASDVRWIESRAGGFPVVNLIASLSSNGQTYLAHAEVIQSIMDVCEQDFCIQDADCLVLDSTIWNDVFKAKGNLYAAGPFSKESAWPGRLIPDTFLVKLVPQTFRDVCRSDGVDASICVAPPESLVQRIRESGWGMSIFPESYKSYFDTLQQFWVASMLRNLTFDVIPGAGQKVFHVGGSSYLTGSRQIDLSHWDYWPANTIYFHLRFIEKAEDRDLRSRFLSLFQQYGSSISIHQRLPGYKDSWRFRETELILNSIFGSV